MYLSISRIWSIGQEIPLIVTNVGIPYFFKASGIIRNNFGQNHFFPLKKSKYLE